MTQSNVRKMSRSGLVLITLALLGACAPGPASEETSDDQAVLGSVAALGPVPAPADNPTTPEKVALGQQLYYDQRLSADGTRSCYSCHLCEHGLTDGKPVAEGALGKVLTRSSPSLWNIGYQTEFYWDGRAPSMERQAMAAWTGGNMGADAEEIVAELNGIDAYREQFQAIFGEGATPDNVVKAISAYERAMLICDDTAFDRWQAGDASAVSDAAKRGAELFVSKAGCGNCHSGSLFTDMKYHNVGIGMETDEPDLGRYAVSNQDADHGAFKTPSLRDVARSAPYFHNGSIATLEEAVDYMAKGGYDNPYLDRENLKDAGLTDAEKADLIEFLKALTCPCDLEEPELPEQ